MNEVEASGQEILDAIRASGQLDADTEAKLKTLLDNYANAFA